MFKLCVFAVILAVALAAPAPEPKPKPSIISYGAPLVAPVVAHAPVVSYAPAVSTYVAPVSSYVAPFSYRYYSPSVYSSYHASPYVIV